MRVVSSLFYLLLVLLPTQLARHFFLGFSQIFGIRSDYLAPTLYFTDIVVILIIIFWGTANFVESCKQKIKFAVLFFLFFVICYLLFNILFIAPNKWLGFYKSIKIVEYLILGLAILSIKPNLKNIVVSFSICLFYSSVLGIWQFIIQKSVGGFFWFLGERTFYASTPGIATFNLFGNLYLRPYATFPHPNVLAAFTCLILTLIFYSLWFNSNKYSSILKIWLAVNFFMGSLVFLLTFSWGVWLVFAVGILLIVFEKLFHFQKIVRRHDNLLAIIIYSLIVFSIGFPFLLGSFSLVDDSSFWQRRELLEIGLRMWRENPIFGQGLNNYLVQIDTFIPSLKNTYLLQPVHNIYLLVAGEVGLVGLSMFIMGFLIAFNKSLKKSSILFIILCQLFLLGLFDHYLITLQQGQLMFLVFISLALLGRNK